MEQKMQPGMQPGRDTLALLYQGLLTGIVRIQSGRQPITDATSFRKRTKDVLAEIEREAAKIGYERNDVMDASYAVVAYLDEAIQLSNDPGRTQWSSLQSEMYERAVAGEGFFERLDGLRRRRDTPRLAEVMEIYCLCLLLGYEGRYGIGASPKGELKQMIAELRERIDSVRGTSSLSPYPLSVVEEAKAAPSLAADAALGRFRIYALASVVLVVVFWVLFRALLGIQAGTLKDTLST